MAIEKDNPGVIAPPPLIFLSGLLIGVAISWYYPQPILPEFAGYLVGGGLVIFGLGIIFFAHSKMAKAETNIEPWKPTTAILSDGIYGISRNPVYLAMIFIYLGAVFIFNFFWLLPPIVLVLIVMYFGVILREEKYLERKFGGEYLRYKKRVRRWI